MAKLPDDFKIVTIGLYVKWVPKCAEGPAQDDGGKFRDLLCKGIQRGLVAIYCFRAAEAI